jgi:transcriptional regulator of acetoin/glycerol metabolism
MSYAKDLKAWQREYWRALMQECGGNVTLMAKRADVNRTDLHGRLVKLGLRPPNRHLGNWGNL